MKGPVTHVGRQHPPWRNPDPDLDQTECGRLLAEVAPEFLVTRDALISHVREVGQQRAAFTTCMTCWNTISRHYDWATDPVSVLGRDGSPWMRQQRTPQQARTRVEMLAVALLEAEAAGAQLARARRDRVAAKRTNTTMRPL